jgi:hypothetical protein
MGEGPSIRIVSAWGPPAVVLTLLLGCGGSGASATSPSGPVAPQNPLLDRAGVAGFWIATPDTRVFDGVVAEHLASEGDLVVINARYQEEGRPTYPDVVRRLRSAGPDLRLLMYTWAGRHYRVLHNGATPTLDGFEDLGSLLIHRRNGLPLTDRRERMRVGDVRAQAFRDWFVGRVAGAVEATGTDGVALDMCIRTLRSGPAATDPSFAEAYAVGFDTLLTSLRTRIRPRFVMCNGLWNHRPGLLADQERVIAHVDGFAIEFFGYYDGSDPPHDFERDVLAYLRVMAAHQDKLILVKARSSRDRSIYVDFAADLRWQRYLFASYLLGAGEHTRFRYNSMFQAVPPRGRAGGLDVYADHGVRLGRPLGPFFGEGALYGRRFQGGLVLVLPSAAAATQYVLDAPMFTPEGVRVQDRIAIEPGSGVLLTHLQPSHTAGPLDASRGWRSVDWRWAEVRNDATAPYLRLTAPPAGAEPEHDLLLDVRRRRDHGSVLDVRYRTADPGASVAVVVELDDADGRFAYGVIRVGQPPEQSGSGYEVARGIAFRSEPHGQFVRMPNFGTDDGLDADGQWRRLRLDAAEVTGSTNRFSFRRFSHLRFVRAMDVQHVRIEAAESALGHPFGQIRTPEVAGQEGQRQQFHTRKRIFVQR